MVDFVSAATEMISFRDVLVLRITKLKTQLGSAFDVYRRIDNIATLNLMSGMIASILEECDFWLYMLPPVTPLRTLIVRFQLALAEWNTDIKQSLQDALTDKKADPTYALPNLIQELLEQGILVYN